MAQELNVSIIPQSYLPEIRVSQNDNTLRVITVNVVNEDGSPYEIPAGATATFAGTKPSGLGFTAACSIEDSAVTFAVSDTMSNEAGRYPAEIRFMDGEDRIGTCNVLMRVEPNPHADDVTDGDREPLVNEITALLQQITEQAGRVEEYSGKVLNMTVTAHESDEANVTKTEGEVVNLDFGLPRGPQGPQGIPGEDGEDGEDGVTPEFSIGTVETLAPGEQATATITGTDEDPVLNLGIPQGAKGDKGDTGEVSMEDFEKVAVTDEASGAIVTFPDGANLPAKSLKLTLEPIQSGSGTPSPDNVRPISGYDEVSANVVGKNLFHFTTGRASGGWSDGSSFDTINAGDSFIVLNGTTTSIHQFSVPNSEIVLPMGTYTVNATAVDECGISVINASTGSTIKTTYGTPQTFTLSEQTRISFSFTILSGKTFNHKKIGYQIELGSTATDYEPYQGSSYTADLPQTVYSGTVDLVSGELVVDRAMVMLNGSQSASGYAERTNTVREMIIGRHFDLKPNITNVATIMSNIGAYAPDYTYSNDVPGISENRNATTSGIWVSIDKSVLPEISSAGMNAYIASNPIQLVYQLATPQTIQLTPQEIRTLVGTNNVWGSGEVYIKYIADTRLYILKVLANA